MIISGNSEQNHKIVVTIADFCVQKGLNNRLNISLKMCALATTLFQYCYIVLMQRMGHPEART